MRKKGDFLWLNWRFSLTYLANQTQNLSAILQNFSTAVEATETAYNSAGSAAEENSRYMESLQARLTAVISSFQELANNILSSDLVGTILDIVNAFLELADTGVGRTIISFGLLTGVLTGGITLIGQFGSSLASGVASFANFASQIKNSGSVMTAFKVQTQEATTATQQKTAAETAANATTTVTTALTQSLVTALRNAVTAMTNLTIAITGSATAINTEAAAMTNAATAAQNEATATNNASNANTQKAATDAQVTATTKAKTTASQAAATATTAEANATAAAATSASAMGTAGAVAGRGLTTLASGASKVATAMSAISTAAGVFGIVISAITLIVKGITSVVDYFTVSLEEQEEAVASLQGELDGLKSEYDQLAAKRDTNEELTQAEEYRLTLLEKQLAIKERQLEIEQQQLFEMDMDAGNADSALGGATTEAGRFESQLQLYEYFKQKLDELGEVTDENAHLVEIYTNNIEDMESVLLDTLSVWSDHIIALQEYEAAGHELPEDAKAQIEAFKAVVDALEDYGIELDFVSDEEDDLADSNDNLISSGWALGDQIAAQTSQANALSESLTALQNEYNAVDAALQEYNETGQISIETILGLLETNGAYFQALTLQNGQLSLNTDWLKARGENLKEEAKAELTAQTMTQLYSIAMQDLGGSIDDTGASASNEQQQMANFAAVLEQVASGALTAGAAMNYLWTSMEPENRGGQVFSEEAKAAMQATIDTYKQLWNQIDDYQFNWSAGAVSGNSSYNSSVQQSVDLLEERKKLLDEEIAIMEHQIFLAEKNGASQEQLIEKYKELQDYVHQQAEWYRSQGLSENSEYIRDLQKQWWDYADEIESIQEEILQAQKDALDEYLSYHEHLLNMNVISEEQYYAELEEQIRNYWAIGVLSAEEYRDYLEELYDWQLSQLEDAADAMKDAYDDLVADTEDKLNAVMDYVADYADEQIDALQSQYDALQDEIDAVNDKYDEQLDALKEENDELNKQIERERLLEALAKARSQRLYVYKEGEGFQYMEDIDAIAEAQEALDEFDREQAYEDMLEEQEAFIEQNRQNELKYLEDEQAALEAEIERWEQYKEGWADIVNNYQKTQNELIAQQVLGTKLEGINWDNRLNLLENFTNMYNQFQDELLANQESVTQSEQWNWNERLQNLRDFYNQYLAILDQIKDLETPLEPGGSTGDYWYGDIDADYSALMLKAKSIEEFNYWAQQRLLKAQAAGIDIEAEGWRSNETLYKQWLQSMGGVAPSNPNWQAPTTGNEDYHPLYGSQQNPNVSNGVTFDPDVDYAAKMLAAATRDEFNYWAERRTAKALAQGIDIFSGNDYRTNDEILQEWLKSKGYNILTSAANTMSLFSDSGYDSSQTPARNLVSTAGYNGGNSTTSYSFAIDNLSLPNATDANSLVSGLRNMAYQYSAQRA